MDYINLTFGIFDNIKKSWNLNVGNKMRENFIAKFNILLHPFWNYFFLENWLALSSMIYTIYEF